MNILYIATTFPEPDKGATIYTDLAEALHEAGHSLTVVVPEESRKKQETQIKKERGFDVLRVIVGDYFDTNYIKKGITTLINPYIMMKSISKYLKDENFDFILHGGPPATSSTLINRLKQKFGCPSYLILKDIFPQNALDLKILNKMNPIYYYFKHKEKSLYKTAEYIGCMSEGNRRYLLEKNPWLNSNKVHIFPNTKKIKKNYFTRSKIFRSKLGIPLDSCLFLLGGNMGKPQYVELLCKALIEFKDQRNMYFLFVGRGTERYKIEQTINEYNITNAKILNNLPRDEYEQITKESDVGLITLDPNFTIPNYPSRILSYMEYAKPVLVATDNNTDFRDLIEKEAKCGKWVWSGDTQEFFNALKLLSTSKSLEKYGQNGRKYLEENLIVEKSVEILEKTIKV